MNAEEVSTLIIFTNTSAMRDRNFEQIVRGALILYGMTFSIRTKLRDSISTF